MGNCHKSRLCQFVHNHCRFLFFGRYESIFNHNDHTSTGSNQTTTSNLNYHNNNCDFHHQQPQTTIGNHQYQGYSAQYGGAATVLSGNSKSQSALVANCSKGGNSNNNGSTATTMANNSQQQQADYKMHRQRSASHCPHQIRSDNVSPAARKCCCPKPKSSGSGGGGTTSRSKSNSKSNSDHTSDPAFGRSKSLRLLNKRFNFFQETNKDKDPRRNSNASSAATTTATCRQPTSATYHHGSSANHQIIYHSNNILTRNSKKQKHHHPKLNELDDRSLTHVFEYLTLKERMLFERVCRRWQCLIRTSLLAPASLKIGEHSIKCNCQCAYFPSWDLPPGKRFPRDEGGYIIYPSKLLEYLLGLCRNLKCINFSHCYLDDKTLQVIMTYSETVECLHLNDIKLEEGNEEDCDLSSPSNSASNDPASTSNNRTAHSSDELLSNGHHQSEENTVTSAVSAFATEQLAVFNGLMRKLSTRKPGKKEKAQPNGIETTVNTSNSGMSNSNQKYVVKQANGNYQTYQAMQMQQHRHSGTSINLQISNQSTRRIMADHELDRSLKITRSSPSPSPAKGSGTQITQIGGNGRPARKSTDPVVGLHYKLGHGNLSYPNITTTAASIVTSDISTNICITPKVINNSPTTTNYMYNMMMNKPCDHEGSKLSLTENSSTNATGTPLNGLGSGKNSNSNIASAVTKEVLSNAIGQRRAQQRRREWSRHRSSQNQNHLQLLQQQQQIMMQQNQQNNNDTSNEEDPLSSSPNMEALANQNNNNNTVTTNTNNTNTNNTNTNNSLGNDDSNSKDSSSAAKRHLMSPNVAPNISSLQTDSDGVRFTSHSNSNSSNGSSGSNASVTGVVGTGNANRSRAQPSDNPNRPNARQNGRFSSHPATSANQNSVDNALAISRFDDIQAFVEQEQRRRETRQSHLSHWKNFSKKLGAQVKSLSIGGLTSVDQVVIDLLLKYCVALDELRINNEIDILSYLTIIKHTVKKIYINCEHGIGLECVSLLAFRNYSEKVVKLGRVDVPPELIDSVISTIGSNFSNLKSLHIRLSHQDIDVSTPANLLFDNLYELNLQFCNTSNINQSVCDDLPFKKIIQLGWSSVESLTIQYASITDDAVKAIGENMPQLKKLFLTAVEFKCDHIGKRYGHRICNICSHSVWKCIATLPHLTQLKLFRVIIDPEICKAISRMSRLTTLDLHYCSNVSDNILTVCTELAKRNPKRRFMLGVVSRRGFLNFSPPPDCHNLFIEVKVVEVERS